jgi:hypothetical protein
VLIVKSDLNLSGNIIWAWTGADICMMDNNRDCAFDGIRPLPTDPNEMGVCSIGTFLQYISFSTCTPIP